MSKAILCTMPGLFGDILGAGLLATRAVAEHFDQPVDLWISHNFKTLAPLIAEQPYVAKVLVDEWNLAETGPVYTYERVHQSMGKVHAPLTIPEGYTHVAHLQYRGWPQPTCYEDCARNAEEDLALEPGTLKPDPLRPWVRVGIAPQVWPLVGAFRAGDPQKAHFISVLREAGGVYVAAPNEEIPEGVEHLRAGWQRAAAIFRDCVTWVGCQSAPWVLANAVHAKRILTCEPDERRHDKTFWLPTPGNRRIGMNAGEILGAL